MTALAVFLLLASIAKMPPVLQLYAEACVSLVLAAAFIAGLWQLMLWIGDLLAGRRI